MSAGEVKKEVPTVVIRTYPLCKVNIVDIFNFVLNTQNLLQKITRDDCRTRPAINMEYSGY